MSTNTTTLDERLRQQARAEVKQEIEALLAPVFRRMSDFQMQTWKVESDGKLAEVSAFTILGQIQSHLIKRACPAREQKAVDAFVSKVNSLHDQIDEVRELTGV